MKTIRLEIKGVSPLMTDKFLGLKDESVAINTSGDKETPREIAKKKVYVGMNGELVVPANNLFRAITEAGKFIKNGKSKLTTTSSSIIPAGLSIVEFELPLNPFAWEPDSRPAVIPATKGRVMVHRPRFDEWGLKMTLSYDNELFSEKTIRELVDLAGSRIGIGVMRPEKKGLFGRFKVVSWVME